MPHDPFAMPTTVNSVERSTPATRRGRCNQAYAAPPLQPNSASGSCCADLIRASTSLFRPSQGVDCMVIVPDIGGRRRALRSWIGLVDRGHLGPAGVTVEHANGRLGSRPHTIRRADQAPMFI